VKTIKLGVALCAALVIAVPAVAAPAERVLGDGSYKAPSSKTNVSSPSPSLGEKFVNPPGAERSGTVPNGEGTAPASRVD
jgi:hypothetical protein